MAMAQIMYKNRDFRFDNHMVQMRLLGDGGCANLVAVHNMLAIKGTPGLGMTITQTEREMMSKLQEKLQTSIDKMKDIPPEEAKEAQKTLASIRTRFCFEPHLTGHLDFAKNGPRLVCELLGSPVLHAWVLDPQEESYDLFCNFSHSELVDHSLKEDNDHLDVCRRLLERSFTSYGIETLHEELSDNGTALLFRHDTLDVICKHNGHIFIFVADETIRKQINADWMLFEEQEEQSIYFTDKFIPVKNQPHSEKALKWYRGLLEKLSKPKEDKGKERKKSSQQGQSDDAGPVPSEAPGKKAEAHCVAAESSESTTKILTTGKGAGAVGSHQSEVRQSDDAGGNSIPSEAAGYRPEAVCYHQGHGGEVLVSHQDSTLKKSPQQAAGVAESSKSTTGILTTGNEAEVTPEEDERARAAGNISGSQDEGHGGEVVVSHQDSTLKKSPQQAGVAESSKSTTRILTTGNEAVVKSEEDERARAVGNISGSQDGVLEGDASDFLKFLDEFKDDGCSNHYFKGVVAAFASQRPLFYVPFEFIMSFNKPLALKIEDNYSRICEDLKKALVLYLSKNGVDSPEAILKIIGRPQAKIQNFVDFVKSIVLHEQYSVLDECPQALPSYDSRRMGLGYLSCIVEKFKTGRSWNGKWSEDNMKVKNGTEFVIDLEEDCELSANTGYQDLLRFCQTVLNRLRIDGQFLPYFDELAEDHMLINECYGDPEKWPRFLLLISNPLALKPPLVRASFICNIYIAGDAHSSGKPPQYGPLYSRKNCINWRVGAMSHQVLLKVYSYLHEQKILRYKYLNDHWSLTHWHLFKFSRYFIQHGLGYTKGEDLTQKIADISVLDILLSCNISKAIAKSVTFLVLHCGVDGIFSSPWRHFMGSDYMDKPEDAIAGGVVQELLHSIEQKSGYVYSEVSLYSGPQHVSIISNTDLTQLQEFLNGMNFECVHKGDYLQYGPVKLKKRICAATKECPEHGVIVLEGPISVEHDCLYDVLLAAEALRNLPPTLTCIRNFATDVEV